jgi:hypothetical protein
MGGHRFQHLGGCDDRLGALVGAPHEILLHYRNLLNRNFHAEVAARDHDAVGSFQDLVEVVQRACSFDFGDDERLTANVLRCLPYGTDVCSALDEGLTDRIDAVVVAIHDFFATFTAEDALRLVA